MILNFGRWLVAVVKEYQGWLAGSVSAGLLALIRDLGWWNPPRSAYIALIILGLIGSVFKAWRTEYLRAELHQAPEIMLSYSYSHGENEQEPVIVRNTGAGTARRIAVEIADGSFGPIFEALPFLAQGEKAALVQLSIVDNRHFSVGGISLGRFFLTYLRMLKSEGNEQHQLVFRMMTASYENDHGTRFAQDFRVSYNVMSEDSRLFPVGQKRIIVVDR